MGKILINEDKCKACGLCVSVCPKKVLVLEEKVKFVDNNECIGCAMCAKRCPDFAIIEVWR